jgi:hypothetical protein
MCHLNEFMKTLLKISILLNLGLLGGLIYMAMDGRKAVFRAMPPVPAEARPPVTEVAVPAPQILPQAQPQPFSWSQFESADYRTYVKNLRGIGCPEPTLRAIVTADVDRVYAAKSQELEQKLTALQSGSWSERLASYNTQQGLESELQKLPGEEDAEIADLLGLKPVPAQVAAAPARLLRNQPPRTQPVSLPLVMQNRDPATLNLNDDQKQEIANLRQQFLEEIGGTNQNPDDPAYLARWRKAQPEVDNQLQAMLGNEVYTKLQMIGYQMTLEHQ